MVPVYTVAVFLTFFAIAAFVMAHFSFWPAVGILSLISVGVGFIDSRLSRRKGF